MLKHATKAASESVFHRARVGAVIAKGERILSTGYNRIGYSRFLRNRPYPESIHAEQAAVLKLLKERRLNDLSGSTIYVSRILRNGHTACALPCGVCNSLLASVGIKEVIYTLGESEVGSYFL